MKRELLGMIVLVALFCLFGCNTDDPIYSGQPDIDWGSGSSSSDGNQDLPGEAGAGDTLSSGLTVTDIELDYSPLNETEIIPTDTLDASYEDYAENSDFTREVVIVYSANGVEITGATDYVVADINGGNVVITATKKKLLYRLKGTSTDGSFKIYSDNKFKLVLDGISLQSSTTAPINIQSKKRCFVELPEGTTNTLIDGSSYNNVTDGEDLKACFFSEGQLIFSGKGRLDIEGNAKHALVSDDYIRFRPGIILGIKANAGHAVKANDEILVNGGVINITVTAAARKGMVADRLVSIMGGRTTIITTGSGAYDSTEQDTDASACIKCDSVMNQLGGTLLLKSTGSGGKGINTDQGVYINGGNLVVQTTGRAYSYGRLSSSPKGIRTEGELKVNGGYIHVTCSGGEGSEGIESKDSIIVRGGRIEAYCYDDCLNAKRNITIAGGYIYAYSSGNDGIDSNGTLTITGGVAVSSGTRSPEEGFDCDQNTFTITGGILAGSGGGTSTPTTSVTKQGVILYGASASADELLHLTDSNGKHILTYRVPREYSSMTLLLSSPSLSKGETYTLSKGGSVTGGNCFHDLTWGATSVETGSKVGDITLSSLVTSYGNVSSMGGGGPGGGWGGGWGRP